MGRPTKQTVDYFPHFVHHGKTLHIIQNLYGNDGYAFFYKLLEVLGDAEGHYYSCRERIAREFLAARTNVSWEILSEILGTLASMSVIDKELWGYGIIWMESFVDSVKDAYRKRTVSVPEKPQLSEFLPPEMLQLLLQDGVSSAGNPQSRIKKIKEKDIGDKPPSTRFVPPTFEEVEAYCRERNKSVNPEKWFNHYTATGWLVGKNRMRDWRAAVRKWESNPDYSHKSKGGLQHDREPRNYPTDIEENL